MNQVKIFVSGRVQGVYFRAYTRKQACKLGLSGYAKNLSDGRVEILAAGNEDSIKLLIDWCHKGPIMAKVNQVITQPVQLQEIPQNFEII